MREPPTIPEEHLRACLRDHYGLSAVMLEFLPLGLDTRAGVYRVVSERGAAYLLKAKAGPIYEPSCLVPRYLRERGVAAAVAPLPTAHGTLWARVAAGGEGDRADWAVTVYPFVEGDTGWNPGLTDAQWEAVGMAFKQIHQVAPPPGGGVSLRDETFDASEYGRWVRAFDAEHARAEGGTPHEQALRKRWMEHRPAIYEMLTTLETLAGALRGRAGPRVICHADLHPGNIIRDPAARVFVIDWDDVMLAPKERDFLFVGAPPSDGVAREGVSPFFRGYGEVEVDWVALAYYRSERVVQDVIAFAQEVFFRDDLGAEAKVDSIRLFGGMFAAGDMVDEARAAAAHLPRASGSATTRHRDGRLAARGLLKDRAHP